MTKLKSEIDDINESTRKYIEGLTAKNKGIAGKPVKLKDITDAQTLEYDAPTDSFVNADIVKPSVDTSFEQLQEFKKEFKEATYDCSK